MDDNKNSNLKVTIKTLESQLETANSEIESLQLKYHNDLTELNSKNNLLKESLISCGKTLENSANQLSKIEIHKDSYYRLYRKTDEELSKAKVELQSYKDKETNASYISIFKNIFLSAIIILSIIFIFFI